jgi:hypothetical protein
MTHRNLFGLAVVDDFQNNFNTMAKAFKLMKKTDFLGTEKLA